MRELIENIKVEEGFVGFNYRDHLGYETIGYGTKLPLTKEEGEMLVEIRLKNKLKEIEFKEPLINKLPIDKQEIIAEMCYQLGVNGCLAFKKMWKALEDGDYMQASKEMLDSKWATQTPDRAKRLASRMQA